MSRNKNVSKTIPNGTILQTRDEYFYDGKHFKKPNYQNKGNYRKAVVVDSNKNNDLAVVKLYSNGKSLINTNSKYKSFVKTLDDSGNNIRLGKKFILTKKRLSKLNVSIIKKDCFKLSPNSKTNRSYVRILKNRK